MQIYSCLPEHMLHLKAENQHIPDTSSSHVLLYRANCHSLANNAAKYNQSEPGKKKTVEQYGSSQDFCMS